MRSSLLSSLSSFGFVIACSSSNGAADAGSPTHGNGVDDVRAACELRAKWTMASSTACNECLGLAKSPRCPCTDQDYAGECSAQQSAETNEPTCDGVSDCVAACTASDCACLDACYGAKPACRTAASAVDGCLADVCASYCQ